MQRIRHIALIALMLFSFVALFAVSAVPAFAASSNRAVSSSRTASGSSPTCDKYGDCCSGEYCCWAQGKTPPSCSTTPTQPTVQPASAPGQVAPVIQEESQLRKLGFQRGLAAGRNSDGAYQDCPEADKMSDFCLGWKDGYEEGLKQRGAGQVPGRKDIPPVAAAAPVPVQPVNDGNDILPTILKGVGIIAILGFIVWIGASLAGLSLAGAAATGIRAGMVLARAAARFLGGNKP